MTFRERWGSLREWLTPRAAGREVLVGEAVSRAKC